MVVSMHMHEGYLGRTTKAGRCSGRQKVCGMPPQRPSSCSSVAMVHLSSMALRQGRLVRYWYG